MKKYTIKSTIKTGAGNDRNTRRSVKMACISSTMFGESILVLAREETASYKHLQNLAKLPLNSTHTIVAVGYIEQYKTECKIMVTRTKLSSTRRKFVQKGDWTELLDYEKVPPLPVSKKRSDLKALHVQTVKHKGQKHKLLLAEDGTV